MDMCMEEMTTPMLLQMEQLWGTVSLKLQLWETTIDHHHFALECGIVQHDVHDAQQKRPMVFIIGLFNNNFC